MRDLVKMASFACLHFCVGFLVAYALTDAFRVAAGVALIGPAVNTIVFFFHGRAWSGAKMKDVQGRSLIEGV